MSKEYDEYIEKHRNAVRKLITGSLLIFQNLQIQ